MSEVLTPSNNATPSFSGTESGSSPVTVEIHEGGSEDGKVVETVTASVVNGKWTSAPVRRTPAPEWERDVHRGRDGRKLNQRQPLRRERAAAVRSDQGPPGGLAGRATAAVEQPRACRFSGTASENGTEVAVHIVEGSTEVATASATATGGTWSTSPLSKELPEGKHLYTAYATEVSGVGNGPGTSNSVQLRSGHAASGSQAR